MVELLLQRIEVGVLGNNTQLNNLEFSLDHITLIQVRDKFKLGRSPSDMLVIKHIVDWMIERSDQSPSFGYFGARIFRLVTGEYNKDVIDVLVGMLDSRDKTRIKTACDILESAPKSLIWNHEYLAKILDTAALNGQEYLDQVIDALQVSANSTISSGQAREQGRRTREMMDNIPPGTPIYHLYGKLKESADSRALIFQKSRIKATWQD